MAQRGWHVQRSEVPLHGKRGARFGRNAALAETWQEPSPAIMTPSPRVVSRDLMTRHSFSPATTLNLLAASWLQFQIRDWFSHGQSVKDDPWMIPLAEGDTRPQPEIARRFHSHLYSLIRMPPHSAPQAGAEAFTRPSDLLVNPGNLVTSEGAGFFSDPPSAAK